MEERNYNLKFVKSSDPNKLIVFKATSYDNHISVYVNENQCFSTYEKDGNILLLLQKESDDRSAENPEFKEMGFKYKTINTISIIILSVVLIFMFLIIKNFYLLIVLYNLIIFSFLYVKVVIYYEIAFSNILKRHHSAEHIMVNFTMENKRLPKSLEEARKNASRFSKGCGTRQLIEKIGERFIISIISFIISFIISDMIPLNISKISFLMIYALFFIILNLLKRKFLIRVLVDKFNLLLSYGIQCVNTVTKQNVKDIDLKLAYYAVKAFVQSVYPEFYEKNDNDEIIPISFMGD